MDYEKHIMPVLLEQVKNWGNGELLAMPYQPYITGVWYNKDLWEEAGLTEQDIPDTWEKLIRVCRKIKNSDSGLSAMTCDEEYVNLLYGYQLARYLGQEKVHRHSIRKVRMKWEMARQSWCCKAPGFRMK